MTVPEAEVEAAWDAEIRRRVPEALRTGVRTVSAREVLAGVRQRIDQVAR